MCNELLVTRFGFTFLDRPLVSGVESVHAFRRLGKTAKTHITGSAQKTIEDIRAIFRFDNLTFKKRVKKRGFC